MSSFRYLVGIIALLVVVAGCATQTPSATPAAPTEPAGEPSPPPPSGAGSATWWVDTTLLPLAPDTRVIKGILVERACASGQSPEGRVAAPVIEYRDDAIVVTFSVAPRPGDQDCPSNPEFPIEVTLTEPLGDRAVLDGSSEPPRDATTLP